MGSGASYEISYGKLHIPLYRVYARPLDAVATIPESAFTGRANTLLALEVDLEVFGDAFLPAYTKGDNSHVVATDSMKNIILRQALTYGGATTEGLLHHIGSYFLATYEDMGSLRLTARALRFDAARVPTDTSGGFGDSSLVFAREHGEHALATLNMGRAAGGGYRVTDHRCGEVGVELFKVTGSAFTRFVRDANTTLPERGDRPLFVAMDVCWRYADTADLLQPERGRYVPAEQMRDLVRVVFHEFVSESIQHLVNEMGRRILDRFPQLSEVSFDAQNRTPDPAAVSEADEKVKVYTAPFAAYGLIRLTMGRGEQA
ncbi:MAG TPA: urate oxidase [Ktedonobacterales bacterium]|jgi:urate oxidase|nr:urate oxidase [Ktedonobacterales bacterium]